MNDLAEAPPPAPATAGHLATQSREVAEMQTKFLMAERFPRDEKRAIDGVINAFSRPGLAERAAYEYAKGGSSINGPSIHAAQAIAQQWGNMEFGFIEVDRGIGADGVPFSTVRSFAIDLQHRTQRPIQFIVRHWRDTKSGGYRLKDERDIYELTANMAQRRTRACILSVLPQDVIDAAMAQAELTLKTKADTSPEAMAKMVEAFAAFKVTKDQIEALIQRRLDSITPAQVVRLKRIYASLRDDMSTPAEWFDMGGPPPDTEGSAAVKDALQARRKGSGAPPPPPPPPAPPAHGLEFFSAQLAKCTDAEVAGLILDEARSTLTEADTEALTAQYRAKFTTT